MTTRGERPKPAVAVDNVCAWPNLTVLRDGTIIATIFNQPSHGLMAGDVECWASRDGGATWTKRGTPASHETEDSNRMNVAAGLANNGDLLVIASGWSSRDASGKPGKPFRARIVPPWVSRSEDGGRTWTIDAAAFPTKWPDAARRSHSPDGICVPFGDILPGDDGELRVALYSGAPGATFVYRSSDDGKTWGEPVAFDKDAVIHEPALSHLGGGKWLVAARLNGLKLYTSDDDGNTWTLRQKLTDIQQHPGHFTRLAGGQVLLSYGNRVVPRGVDVRFSDDQGQTWSEPFRVVDFENDGGYPSSIQRPDGRVLTAYYARRIAGHDRYHMGVVVWDPVMTRRRSPTKPGQAQE
jgi:Neuraminidase (sialidase)